MRALADAVALLTRIPLPDWRRGAAVGDVDIARAAVWFPLVGAGIGLIVAGTAILGGRVLPAVVAAVLAVTLETVLTGALHLDGLADSADGLAGGDRDHTLAIMRDHGVGVYGAAALVMALLLKATVLAALLAAGAGAVPLVVAAYALSRAAPLPLACVLDYARAEGTGRALAQGLGARRAAAGVGMAVLVSAIAGWTAVLMLSAATVTTVAVGRAAYRRIGGITGDVLGAGVELALQAGLLVAVAVPR